jgi:hypothetical protein
VDDKLNNLLDYVKKEHSVLCQKKINNFTNNVDHVLNQLHEGHSLQKYEKTLKEDFNVTKATIDRKILQNNLEIMSYIYLAVHYSSLHKVVPDCQHNYITEDLLDM